MYSTVFIPFPDYRPLEATPQLHSSACALEGPSRLNPDFTTPHKTTHPRLSYQAAATARLTLELFSCPQLLPTS